ncbi:unnamed protein product [Sympodiomycopsis kandeliae]
MGKKRSKQPQSQLQSPPPQQQPPRPNPRRRAQEEESRFSKLSSHKLETLNLIAHNTVLERPIPCCLKFYQEDNEEKESIPLPKKPRWHHDLSAKAVQSNEDSVFQDWLNKADGIIRQRNTSEGSKGRLPCQFERNVQVYRQLWRVLERSKILLVLLDARCPPVHLPPSLESFLTRFANRRTILVLTKKDIVGEQIASQWRSYLQEKYPHWQVVVTESYQKRTPNEGQGQRHKFVPFLSPQSRSDLFEAIQRVHAGLVTPPARIRDDDEQLKQWKPPCDPHIDWAKVQHNIHTNQYDDDDAGSQTSDTDPTLSFDTLTIGLIGQPNVGKSSLLNALLGTKVVHASKTPGKTKHFQTHSLYSHKVWLCDSPGLVFPNENIGQELQILNNILSIAQCQAISTCILFIARHIPLEKVLSLDLPDEESKEWTAVKILEALAKRHNYKTAKAGRWDTNRAGNALLRSLAEARIPWAFRPPNCTEGDNDGNGIWIPHTSATNDHHTVIQEEDDDSEHEQQTQHKGQKDKKEKKNVSFDLDSDQQEEEEEPEDEEQTTTTTSMFNALAVEGGETDSDSDGHSEGDSEDESGAKE